MQVMRFYMFALFIYPRELPAGVTRLPITQRRVGNPCSLKSDSRPPDLLVPCVCRSGGRVSLDAPPPARPGVAVNSRRRQAVGVRGVHRFVIDHIRPRLRDATRLVRFDRERDHLSASEISSSLVIASLSPEKVAIAIPLFPFARYDMV
jgi:hypothetical protein